MKHPFWIDSYGKIRTRPFFPHNWSTGWLAPLRRHLDYQGIARRALVIDSLPQGALPTYDRDIDIASIIGAPPKRMRHDYLYINSRGKICKRFGFFVTVPPFEIFSSPMVKLSEIKERRFDLMDRYKQKAISQIMGQEDDAIFKALDNKEEE